MSDAHTVETHRDEFGNLYALIHGRWYQAKLNEYSQVVLKGDPLPGLKPCTDPHCELHLLPVEEPSDLEITETIESIRKAMQ